MRFTRAVQPAGISIQTSLTFRPSSYVERLDLGSMFPSAQPLEVELGCGDGGFLAQWAARHSERNFIGVERLLGRLRKLDRKGRRAGLSNLRLLRIEASYLLKYLLPAGSVAALHIYFPDPWPKRRHWKHRLITPEFVAAAAGAMARGGVVFLRTDDAPYFAQMQESFGGSRLFSPVETPAELAALTTEFEREFHAIGRLTLRAAYERVV
jgi:tRNA (guanine-N7-)-methyltransferase